MGFPYIPFFLSLSCIYADIILPVTTTSVNFTSPAIATGVSSVTLIPFDVDFISLPDYQTESAYDRYSNSIWTTKVAVYDDTENFDSVISLSWPAGKGPGAPPVANKTWSACVIAMPDLFTKLNITSQGNGTCFDVVDSDCLYHLMTTALSYWDSSIDGQTNLTDSVLTQACKSAAGLPLISQCFGRSTGSQSSISGYSTLNPPNGQPFLLGVNTYNVTNTTQRKSDFEAQTLAKVWPLIILESEGNYSVQATASCPSAKTDLLSRGISS